MKNVVRSKQSSVNRILDRAKKEVPVKAINDDGTVELCTRKEARAWRKTIKTRIKDGQLVRPERSI